MPGLLPALFLLIKWLCAQSQPTAYYIIDSKPLAVCDNHRISTNMAFGQKAARGKSSMGWFFGWKVQLVINQYGELINFMLTQANVADNNAHVLTHLLDNLKGQCFGHRAYLSSLFYQFYQNGLQILTKLRRKMKNMLMPLGNTSLRIKQRF